MGDGILAHIAGPKASPGNQLMPGVPGSDEGLHCRHHGVVVLHRQESHLPDARFHIGQLIQHRKYGYRGVVFDVDPRFMGTDAWYDQVAVSRPPKDRPWYHVLVHGAEHTTYVAERHMQADPSPGPVEHPMLEVYFGAFEAGVYRTRRVSM